MPRPERCARANEACCAPERVKAPTSNHPEDKPLGKGTDVEDEEGGYEEDGTDDDTEDDEVIDEKPLSL